LNDQTVPLHDPLKMVARLQAESPAGGPYLLLPLRASGHAGGTTLMALIEQDRRRAELLLLDARHIACGLHIHMQRTCLPMMVQLGSPNRCLVHMGSVHEYWHPRAPPGIVRHV
jgi:hypothetical protein